MGGSHDTFSSASATHHGDDYSPKAIGIAFGLTLFAGFATTLGGAIVFLNKKDQRFNPRVLSGGLSVAAGAIIYIAFADLLPEGTEFFVTDAKNETEEQLSTMWSTLCLFSGAALMALLSWATHRLSPKNHSHGLPIQTLGKEDAMEENEIIAETKGDLTERSSAQDEDGSFIAEEEQVVVQQEEDICEDEKTSLCQSGISTAVALVMHSLPEGLVTFIATAQDPTIGAALTIGIAIHNVVEGMSIALPIYFATKEKGKAFGASALAGLAPIFGGLIGYVILETADFSNTAFGVMFGLAAGMLIYIAIKELLRTAYKYDPEDRVTTLCFFVGMALIALALVILESTGNHNHALGSGGHGSDMEQLEVLDWNDGDEPPSVGTIEDHHHGHDAGVNEHHHY